MAAENKEPGQKHAGLERRGFLYTVMGGAIAALAGWVAGIFPRAESVEQDQVGLSSAEARISALEATAAVQAGGGSLSTAEARISALEAKVAAAPGEPSSASAEARISALEAQLGEQSAELESMSGKEPIAELQGGNNELVVFNRKELSLVNPDGVLLNLVATNGPVGIRFYKDFSFGNEQQTNPWHMGYIEGLEGYQSLAILRDWRFTAALWDEDGKLLLGRLDPYPPGNEPGKARFQVRGTVDEVQAIIQASGSQKNDIFQVTAQDGTKRITVNSAGDLEIGSAGAPKDVILHDTADGTAYALQVTNGRLGITKL